MKLSAATSSLLAASLLTLGVGCAPKRPVLYPNQLLSTVGPDEAERDIDTCIERANSDGYATNRPLRLAGRTAGTSAVGAAMGAAWGAVRGAAGSRAGAGAAAGAAGGLLTGLFGWRERGELEMGYVETCLGDFGYQTIGWR